VIGVEPAAFFAGAVHSPGGGFVAYVAKKRRLSHFESRTNLEYGQERWRFITDAKLSAGDASYLDDLLATAARSRGFDLVEVGGKMKASFFCVELELLPAERS